MRIIKAISVVIIFTMALITSNANGQQKIGYINMNSLIDQMPEIATVKVQLQAYEKQFSDQYGTMVAEFQKIEQDYQTQKASMTDALRTAKETELSDMQKRIQDFEQKAKNQMDTKQSELAQPIIDKARKAALDVANEKGYDFLFDTSTGDLMKGPPGNDLMDAVKAKLGLK